ncbi:MAG: DUF3310 domain-containing protein [Desulfurellales bacterium]|nr:MAG: DUF3310 domain-containing protein [Desulfurellales bacterium]
MDERRPCDAINPQHYRTPSGIECIELIEAVTSNLKGIEAFCTGNAMKYLFRWKEKGGVVDLKKARWYVDRLIAGLDAEAERCTTTTYTTRGGRVDE